MRKLLLPLAVMGLAACSPQSGEMPAIDTAALEASETAADVIGLPVGAEAPPFMLANAAGETVTLENLAGENGTVLYFNRSVDWCPYCQAQVIELDIFARQFANRGYGLAVITYDTVETLQAFSDRRSISIELLSDPDSSLVAAYDIRDPAYTDPDHYAYGVPYPITFIIDRDGVIIRKLWHEPGFGEMRGYRDRISVRDVLSTLDEN